MLAVGYEGYYLVDTAAPRVIEKASEKLATDARTDGVRGKVNGVLGGVSEGGLG